MRSLAHKGFAGGLTLMKGVRERLTPRFGEQVGGVCALWRIKLPQELRARPSSLRWAGSALPRRRHPPA